MTIGNKAETFDIWFKSQNTRDNPIFDISDTNKTGLTFDILFHRLDVKHNLKLSNAVEKLKLVLACHSFAQVDFFCQIFMIQLKNLENDSGQDPIIDVILESKVYLLNNLLDKLKD